MFVLPYRRNSAYTTMTQIKGSVIQGSFPLGLAQLPRQLMPAQRPGVRQALHLRGTANGSAVALPADSTILIHGPGTPLPNDVRQKMEALFGTSFSRVRIHVGAQASQLGTVAFTRGTDICFAPGRYDVTSPRGSQILGHELAHVVQQQTGRARNPFGSGVALVHDRVLEAEAERMAAQALHRHAATQSRSSRAAQALWLRQGGKIVWTDKKLNPNDIRPTGEKQWYSWWKPREFNELMPVFESRPAESGLDMSGNRDVTDLRLVRKTLSDRDIKDIGLMTSLRHLELTNCKFPNQWSTRDWEGLIHLQSLNIFSPNTCTLSDGMAGLTGLPSLRVLQFVRCDFFNSANVYAAIGTMTNLTYLDLGRTLTKEKAHGQSVMRSTDDNRQIREVTELDPAIMKSLWRLIGGALRTLDIRWCTALTDRQIQGLVDYGFRNGCQVMTTTKVVVSLRAEIDDLLERIPK
jgi:hypothetical protein